MWQIPIPLKIKVFFWLVRCRKIFTISSAITSWALVGDTICCLLSYRGVALTLIIVAPFLASGLEEGISLLSPLLLFMGFLAHEIVAMIPAICLGCGGSIMFLEYLGGTELLYFPEQGINSRGV